MATFKVKDLMIQLGDKVEPFERTQQVCAVPSLLCNLLSVICRYGTTVEAQCTWATCQFSEFVCIDPTEQPKPYVTKIRKITDILTTLTDTDTPVIFDEQGGDLVFLKEQLRQTLEIVDQAVLRREEALVPKTIEEIDKLELHLNAALEDLRERREKLN